MISVSPQVCGARKVSRVGVRGSLYRKQARVPVVPEPHLEAGDILIDGGNSYYVDYLRRAKQLAQQKIHYVDVGTSGGVWGLES